LIFKKNANFLPKMGENRRKQWSHHLPKVAYVPAGVHNLIPVFAKEKLT
jgi:hypothetical protein